MSKDRHPIIIETWCKTNGCRADVYRQEIRRLKDEKLALEADNATLRKELDAAVNMDLEVKVRQALEARLSKMGDDYHELLFAVVKKHEGETRHETALHYITEHENRPDTEALAGEEEA